LIVVANESTITILSRKTQLNERSFLTNPPLKGNYMSTKEVAVNYTAEMTAKAVEMYKAGEAVDTIAVAVGKTARSVIAKLSREGVYASKAKEASKRVTKADLVAKIAEAIEADTAKLESLEKASHEALELVAKALA